MLSDKARPAVTAHAADYPADPLIRRHTSYAEYGQCSRPSRSLRASRRMFVRRSDDSLGRRRFQRRVATFRRSATSHDAGAVGAGSLMRKTSRLGAPGLDGGVVDLRPGSGSGAVAASRRCRWDCSTTAA